MKKVFIYSLPLLIFLLASTFINAQTLDREEIDDKYKWNLEDLYSSVAEWRQDIAKIEVHRGGALLREQVGGVIAVASDRALQGENVFPLHDSRKLVDFIEENFLNQKIPKN